MKNKQKHLRDNFCSDLNNMNVKSPDILVHLPAKGRLSGDGFSCQFFWKVPWKQEAWKARKQFHSEQLDLESGDSEEDSYISTYGAFVGKCPSVGNSAHSKKRGLEIESSQWKKQW